jgi:uncharacterized coiled-coil protein SlyX
LFCCLYAFQLAIIQAFVNGELAETRPNRASLRSELQLMLGKMKVLSR